LKPWARHPRTIIYYKNGQEDGLDNIQDWYSELCRNTGRTEASGIRVYQCHVVRFRTDGPAVKPAAAGNDGGHSGAQALKGGDPDTRLCINETRAERPSLGAQAARLIETTTATRGAAMICPPYYQKGRAMSNLVQLINAMDEVIATIRRIFPPPFARIPLKNYGIRRFFAC
jgi:hypothetical protein